MKSYTVEIGGVQHTLQLSDEDAKRYGDRAVAVKQAEPSNKSRQPANKSGSGSTK